MSGPDPGRNFRVATGPLWGIHPYALRELRTTGLDSRDGRRVREDQDVPRKASGLGTENEATDRAGWQGPLPQCRERRLVRDAQRGSEAALAELYEAHWRRAYRAAYLIVHDASAAEDVAQDGFLAALDALDRFDRRRPFAPWLHRIVANRAIDWARREALRRRVDAEQEVELAGLPREQIGDELMAALAELPAEQRAVVVLRFLLDYTPGEIARMLELPRGTVNSRLRRALDRLGGRLEAAN